MARQGRFWLGIFALGAGLNVIIGARYWPGVLAGNLNDPDSYMRLERIFQGVQEGHLTIFVARDGPGRGVMVEWSRLLDGVIWAMAAPLAVVLGWRQALFAAGVALGPLGAAVLGVSVAFAAEPFAARRFLWFGVVAAAGLPGIAGFALPGVVHYHVLLLAMIAFTGGFAARAWEGEVMPAFFAGIFGGLAIWLTPETMPFVLMIFAAMLGRWLMLPIGTAMAACAAGFADVIGLGFTLDPPAGGYLTVETDRLSVIYVVLALFLLAGALGLWRLERRGLWRRWRWWAAAGMAALIGGWVVLFPAVAEGPYGLMTPDQMQGFFGVMTELQPLHAPDFAPDLLPGTLALAFVLWRCLQGKGLAGRWLAAWGAVCVIVTLTLARKFTLFIEFPALAAAMLLPAMLNDLSARLAARPAAAMGGRLSILAAMLLVPTLAVAVQARAASAGGAVPPDAACSLRDIGPTLAPYAGAAIAAPAEAAPELLYRTHIHIIGSLYQHGLPGYFAMRAIWRSPVTTAATQLAAANARLVLICPGQPRSLMVADLPATTLWDALNSNHPPPWLRPLPAPGGYRLYEVAKGQGILSQ
jgi:hypothetical protein